MIFTGRIPRTFANRHGNSFLPAGFDIQHTQRAVSDGGAVFGEFPVGLEKVFQVGKDILILHFNKTFGQVRRMNSNVLIDFFGFMQMGVGFAVGLDQTVAAEVAVVGLIAEVAAIGPECFAADRVNFLYALIDPVPDKAALQRPVFFNDNPVIGQIAAAVAHGVRIFTKNQRAVNIVTFGVRFNLMNPGVHRTDNVSVGTLMGRLVLNRPA